MNKIITKINNKIDIEESYKSISTEKYYKNKFNNLIDTIEKYISKCEPDFNKILKVKKEKNDNKASFINDTIGDHGTYRNSKPFKLTVERKCLSSEFKMNIYINKKNIFSEIFSLEDSIYTKVIANEKTLKNNLEPESITYLKEDIIKIIVVAIGHICFNNLLETDDLK